MVEKQLNEEFLTLCYERNFDKLKENYNAIIKLHSKSKTVKANTSIKAK